MKDKDPLLWCSLHKGGRCALGRQARKLFDEIKAGQAAVLLQTPAREGRPLHMVVCTGGECGTDLGWLQDVAGYATTQDK